MNRKTLLLVFFIVLKFVLQFSLISEGYELHRDEFLHLDQAHHLAWGFLSVPPATSWVAWLIDALGNNVFWVKFFPALFGVLTLVVVWKTIEALGGGLFALALGATGLLFSVLFRLNILFQPNSLDVLAWTACYFMVIRWVQSENPKWLYGGALVFALGFLNKYNILFLLLGLLPALLFSSQRKIFARRDFYLALLLGVLLVLPNIWWQYTHGFPVIHHMAELRETQLTNVSRTGFLTEQLLFFIGALFLLLAGFYSLLFYGPFSKYRFLSAAYLFTITLFLYFKAKGYYAIGLYPVFIAFGAAYMGSLSYRGWRMIIQPLCLAVPVLLFIPIYQVAFPNRSPAYIQEHAGRYRKFGLLRWEDGKDHVLPQDFADMLGWRELAVKVDSCYAHLPDPEKTLVLCDNYGEAGAINYYSKKGIRAVSFNADYINWFNLKITYRHLIRVKESGSRETELEKTSPYFESSVAADSVRNPFAREYGTTVFVFKNAKISINERIAAELAKKQSSWLQLPSQEYKQQ